MRFRRPDPPRLTPGIPSFLLLLFLLPMEALALQETVVPPNRGGFTESMGRPPATHWNAGFAIGADRADGGQAIGHLNAGFYRDLVNPALAAVGLEGYVYGGRRGDFERFREGWDVGGGIGVASPVARLAVGVDLNGVDRSADVYLSLIHPLRRSGFPVPGGRLRATWIPGRNHSTSIGLSFPVGQRFAGRTRPLADRAVLPRIPTPIRVPYTPSAALEETLALGTEHAHALRRLVVPFVDSWHRDPERSLQGFAAEMTAVRDELTRPGPGSGLAGGVGPQERIEAYHRTMATAFSLVLAGEGEALEGPTEAGMRAWDLAREILLEDLLIPYNRLLGRKRARDSVLGLGAVAAMDFYERLASMEVIPEDRVIPSAWLFARVLEMLEEVREASVGDWDDPRFVFLPFQLALRPGEVESQEELDAFLERALETRFAPGNEVFYVENEQFQAELSRMIHEARDYSVLWIHDYRGVDGSGAPDAVAHFHAVETYLRALVAAVRRYDETGKIPQHLVLLDQWFYQANRGWIYLDLLRDPLRHELRLPAGFAAMEAEVRQVQEELRTAISESTLLQAQARHAPPGWIENLVRVHVNITNPADASFWTGELLPWIGMPDMVARDHRKVAFFDLSEEDPYRGRAIYTGMGIGTHYAGAGWEDRALMVRGPAALNLKTEARRVLLGQGFGEDEIPWELRPRPLAPDYGARVEEFRRQHPESARALEVHNEVGFGDKRANLLKAMLYTLLPPGAVVKAPDSLWNHPLWGSMLLGHALRGGRVLLIAPSLSHAPSDGFPQMSRAQELLGRMVLAGEILQEPLGREGGFLRVGLYDTDATVGDTPERIRQVVATLETEPWLQELLGFGDGVIGRLEETAARLQEGGFNRTYLVGAEATTPRLHLKAHFVASREAWDGLLSRDAAGDLLTAYFEAIAQQNLALAEGRAAPMDLLTRAVMPPGRALAQAQLRARAQVGAPGPREEGGPGGAGGPLLYYLSGSHNQNYRSSTTDGELVFLISGWPSLHGLPDFVVLAGLATWISSLEELEALFPPYSGLRRRIGRFLRLLV
jgi:hypothetical protein